MKYVRLPNTDLEVSGVCLGTVEFGSTISREDSFALMDAFVDAGGKFMDTANVYADWQTETPGISERTIGEWVSSRGCADSVIVATKGGHPAAAGPRLSPEQVYSDLKESIRRLQADRIDLYWLHRDNPGIPVDQILGILESARGEGLICYYGASNWSVGRLREAAAYVKNKGITGMVASQIQWSLADIRPECIPDPTTAAMDSEILAYHQATGLPQIPFGSQANGFFSGKYSRSQPESGRPEVRRLYDTERNWSRLERACELAGQLGCTCNQVCLAYLMAQPFPTIPIVGCRRMDQMMDSIGATDVNLTDEQVEFLKGV